MLEYGTKPRKANAAFRSETRSGAAHEPGRRLGVIATLARAG